MPVLQVRLTQAEYDALSEHAAATGQTMSAVIHRYLSLLDTLHQAVEPAPVVEPSISHQPAKSVDKVPMTYATFTPAPKPSKAKR
jgi:hypothetical protein